MATEQRTVKEKLEVTDREALLRSILESPQDDTPRLIYTNWLDENGESERAEFVRVQIELARSARPCPMGIANAEVGYQPPHSCFMCSSTSGLIYDCDNPKELRRRERELWDWHWQDWIPQIERGCSRGNNPASGILHDVYGGIEVTASRGFIASLTCSWSDWLAHEAALYWHSTQTVECVCQSLTYDDIAFRTASLTATARLKRVNCDQCKDGRVPRPFIATAQPLERVRLTESPPLGMHNDEMDCTFFDEDTRFTCRRWPGITFEITPRRRYVEANFAQFGAAALRDVARGMAAPLAALSETFRDMGNAARVAGQTVLDAWPRDADGNLIELGEPAATDGDV